MAGGGAGRGRGRRRRRRRAGGGPAAPCRASVGGAAIGTPLSSSARSGGSTGASLIGTSTLGARLRRPAGTRGSGRSGRARAGSAVSASRITTGRRNTIRLVASCARGSRCGTARRGSGMSPSSGTLRLVVGVAVLDQAAEHDDLAVVDHDVRFDRALVGRRAGVRRCRARRAGDRLDASWKIVMRTCRPRRSAA